MGRKKHCHPDISQRVILSSQGKDIVNKLLQHTVFRMFPSLGVDSFVVSFTNISKEESFCF
jgi:hypothetical protein